MSPAYPSFFVLFHDTVVMAIMPLSYQGPTDLLRSTGHGLVISFARPLQGARQASAQTAGSVRLSRWFCHCKNNLNNGSDIGDVTMTVTVSVACISSNGLVLIGKREKLQMATMITLAFSQ